MGELEVSFDRQIDEIGCTQDNSKSRSLYDEPLYANDNIETLFPLHANQRNKEIEAYSYVFESCDEPYVSYMHDINSEE